MTLATLSDLKDRLHIAQAHVAEDAFLDALLASCSARFEKECNRAFARTEGATYEFPADIREIVPPLQPIESITAWHLKTTETEGWVALAVPDFLIRRGCVVSLPVALGTWQQQGRITYDGGFVLPDAEPGPEQIPLPADLEQGCIEQCTYWFQNRNRLGMTAVSGEGGSIQNFSTLDLLPNVKATLKKHERWVN